MENVFWSQLRTTLFPICSPYLSIIALSGLSFTPFVRMENEQQYSVSWTFALQLLSCKQGQTVLFSFTICFACPSVHIPFHLFATRFLLISLFSLRRHLTPQLIIMSLNIPRSAPARLLTIPIELRLRIYEDLVQFQRPLRRYLSPDGKYRSISTWRSDQSPVNLSILRVNKQICHETLGVLYQKYNGKENEFILSHNQICTGIRWTGSSWSLNLDTGLADLDRHFPKINNSRAHEMSFERELRMSCLEITHVVDELPPYKAASGLSLLKPDINELLRHVIDIPSVKRVVLSFESIVTFKKTAQYLLTLASVNNAPPPVYRARDIGELEIDVHGTHLRLESHQLVEGLTAVRNFEMVADNPVWRALAEWRVRGNHGGEVLKPFVNFVQTSSDGRKSYIKKCNGLTSRTADLTLAISSYFWEQGGRVQPNKYPRKDSKDYVVFNHGKPVEWNY